MPGKRVPAKVRREQILQAAFEVAARDGVAGLTVRAVAAEANISHALVLFHFERKDEVVEELLEWLISRRAVLEISEDFAGLPRAIDRLHALLQQEMHRISERRVDVRLFFEYWSLGARNERIRKRISGELERYRATIEGVTRELIVSEPATFPGITAAGLASVAVSWIHGCAMQATIDPKHFDTDQYLAAVRNLVSQVA